MWPEETQLAARVTSLLKRRIGTSEIAIEDMHSRQILSLGGQSPQYEASVVKVNILTALLAEKHDSTAPLSLSQQKLAQEMIEVSDNDAATALWNAVGGTGGIAAFNRKIGLTKTTPSKCVQCPGFPWPGWGLTTTTPDDEIKLLKEVFFANETLSAADQGYERQLMQSITPSEKWGVTNGVASGATVALKNGWLPLNSSDTDWQINSVGWVRGDGRDYVIALFSTGNPSEQYGISTLNAISSMAWQYARN
jgi:beta-lactamase class A